VDGVPLCLNPNEDRATIQSYLDGADTLIGFNIKFDLHWLRRYGFDYSHCRIFDCQLAEFILGGQSEPYPSLNKTAERYGLGTKVDVVKTEYWDKGIDTTEIPIEILDEYLTMDLVLTNGVF
jgi:DNA polymerase I-like protein with 3'-5' exonuclease and polymerase domains